MKIVRWMRTTTSFILLLGAQLALSNLANSTPTIQPIAAQSNNEGETVSISVIASTDVTGATLSYSATGLPGGVFLNPNTGLISGTLNYDSSGNYSVTVTVTENSATPLTASTTFAWQVTDVNRPPFTVPQPGFTISENQRGLTSLLFADSDYDTLVITSVQLPSFVQVTNTIVQPGTLTVELEALPGANDAGEYDLIVSVTDNRSPAVTSTVHLTVLNVNQPPQITNPGAQTSQIGESVTLAIVATDPDQDVLTYSAQNLPDGLSIDSATGVISGMIATTANLSYDTTITVADGTTASAAQSQVSFNWTITPAAPTITILSPGDQINAEGETVSLPIDASSSDSGTLLYSATGLPTGLSIDATGTITGELNYDSAGTYSVTVAAQLQADPTISASTSFSWLINNTNRAPIANAGPDENVMTGEMAAVDGSASTDPDGQMLTFSWRVITVPVGSTVNDASLSGASTPQATFIPDVDGIYELDLEVSDGSITAIDSVVLTASTPPNIQPNANAGADQEVELNASVMLDGSASNDPDNYPQTLSYRWYFSSVPAASSLLDANIFNANTEQASFSPDVVGVYVLSLEVSDGRAFSTDQVQVTAIYTNVAPVANAGDDQTVASGTLIQLDGSASSDPDQYPQALTYTWSVVSVPAGSAITTASITDANMANASIMPDINGVYLLRLDVSDGEASAFDQMTITVQPAGDVPTAPYRVKALFMKDKVYLFWRSSSAATHYIIYRKIDGETEFSVAGQASKTRFKDRLPSGTQSVEYYIVAVNQYGMSEPSVVVSTQRASHKYRDRYKDWRKHKEEEEED